MLASIELAHEIHLAVFAKLRHGEASGLAVGKIEPELVAIAGFDNGYDAAIGSMTAKAGLKDAPRVSELS